MPVAITPLEALIRRIAYTRVMANVFNPWLDHDQLDISPQNAADFRRTRLREHFNRQPRFLLIGEAPGYQGCHFSGVPFTNEALIVSGRIPGLGHWENRFTRRQRPWSEPSASIVWNHLHFLGIAAETVMWNAFAWHPHKPDLPMSNRAPTRDELLIGLPILLDVLDYFKGAKIIAVGNVAEKTLTSLGIQVAAKVRHPSMGGANQFREQLTAVVA